MSPDFFQEDELLMPDLLFQFVLKKTKSIAITEVAGADSQMINEFRENPIFDLNINVQLLDGQMVSFIMKSNQKVAELEALVAHKTVGIQADRCILKASGQKLDEKALIGDITILLASCLKQEKREVADLQECYRTKDACIMTYDNDQASFRIKLECGHAFSKEGL